ncbi:MAG: hypothetical protein JWQ09_2837 [Segetibacter sp.]|nr:hypothetical protein [Segetibacter sp.]
MSAIELKERLIEKIQTTNDENILEEAYRLLELETNDSELFKFSDEQKTEIDSVRAQLNQGQFLTNDKANNEIDEWLNK